MKMVQVNSPALEAAIKAIGGEEGYRMVEHAYGVLDAYERQVRCEVEVDREKSYKEGFEDGYECARGVFLGCEQPDVICLPDESHLGPHDPREPELPFMPIDEEAAIAMLEGCPA